MPDPEVLVAGVHLGHGGVGIDCLEADAEPPDRGQVTVLRGFADSADAPHIGLVEGPPVVADNEPLRFEYEAHLRRAGVLGVLQQLEDEVRSVGVEALQEAEVTGAFAVFPDVLLADARVVTGHG
nr:hypothetical protein [Micromonospora cremea]